MSGCPCKLGDPPVLHLDCPVHGAQARKLAVKAIDEGKLITPTPPCRCELCGAVEETRPYGPHGEEVCFDCGMKDEEAMDRGFAKRFGFERKERHGTERQDPQEGKSGR